MPREMYVTDGEYSLFEFTEEDKDDYLRLIFPEDTTLDFYREEENREMFWKIVNSLKEKDYSIYNSKDMFCGMVLLKQYDTTTPEIGIDLLEEHRNKGIAGKAIKMLAKKYYEENEKIEYFVLRVSSYNAHSKHMIEKIGAEFVCEEETLAQRAIRVLREDIGEDKFLKIREKCKTEYGMSEEEQDEVVYRYKLMPSAFLN